MKCFKLFVLAILFVFTSCEIDSYESTELKASKLASSEDAGCETGFAICAVNLSTCFIDDGFGRWGWTIGPVSPGLHQFAIFTGAGRCDTSKGIFAGKVRLDYNGDTGTATVKYLSNEGFVYHETHLYIGNEPYPMQKQGNKVVPTVAPGQYPYKHDDLNNVKTDTYTINGLSGDIYIIAHAVICESPAVE